MMDMEFTRPHLKFIFECIEKELFFAESDDDSPLVNLIGEIVEAELYKIENDYIDCKNPKKDIQTANQILTILRR
jgi:hypothetical protein